ncbi:MAG: hypothetical protein HC922_11125 [Leptolyngbyaceae cyanobacterium SM2_3_12]|nr:hypothetical protein [Leptolyngbyaceae cyanobacterium SM2_3_12]
MATDYVLFVHGVKNRSQEAFIQTSRGLLEGIRQSLNDNSRTLKPIYFYWGDLNIAPQQRLLRGLEASPQWKNLLFKNFRTQEFLEFVGDAALYLSRHVGSQVVYRFKETALAPLQNAEPGDRLHLVTHSMGTVILFDLLFAGRWEDPRLDQDSSSQNVRQIIDQIRDVLFGTGRHPGMGLPIASIHTMGSPIALFTLLSVTGESSHDLTGNLRDLLQNLYRQRGLRSLPWRNFIHPGDPIAYPLQGLMPDLLGNAQLYVRMLDVMTENRNPPLSLGLVPLLWGGDAHGSYWKSRLVAKTIGEAMR